ncbi:MAG: FkbM family methyltransferase [Candidatus Nezhaarchaeota archaeon]|nr:FkbM family methyltransferase [Candidatus Nezhaarchaeota archaeon]
MKRVFVALTSILQSLRLVVWWVVKLFALAYGTLFFHSDHVTLPTVWGCRFILPKKGFSKYLLLSIMTGLYELEWRPYFDSFIRSARFFVDVGAAADGYYSFRAFKMNKRLRSVALEPLQFEFEYLIKNVLVNRASERIIPLKLALGEGCGEILVGQEKVPMLSLDELVERLILPHVDVIKIDVEGAGLSVIQGALMTISKNRPIIFLEIHNDLENQALETLKTFGYNFIIRKGKAVAIPQTCRR